MKRSFFFKENVYGRTHGRTDTTPIAAGLRPVKLKIKVLSFPVSEKKNFEVGLLCTYVRTCDPRDGVGFDPGDHMNKIEKVHKEMLNTKYQSFKPSSFREEEF